MCSESRTVRVSNAQNLANQLGVREAVRNRARREEGNKAVDAKGHHTVSGDLCFCGKPIAGHAFDDHEPAATVPSRTLGDLRRERARDKGVPLEDDDLDLFPSDLEDLRESGKVGY
jgi:hypothetical protein